MLSRLCAVLIAGLGALALGVSGEAAACAPVLEAGGFRRDISSAEIKRCEEDSTSSTVATTAAPTICSQACAYMSNEIIDDDDGDASFIKWAPFDSSNDLTQTDHYCAQEIRTPRVEGGMEGYDEKISCYFTNKNNCDEINDFVGLDDAQSEHCATRALK